MVDISVPYYEPYAGSDDDEGSDSESYDERASGSEDDKPGYHNGLPEYMWAKILQDRLRPCQWETMKDYSKSSLLTELDEVVNHWPDLADRSKTLIMVRHITYTFQGPILGAAVNKAWQSNQFDMDAFRQELQEHDDDCFTNEAVMMVSFTQHDEDKRPVNQMYDESFEFFADCARPYLPVLTLAQLYSTLEELLPSTAPEATFNVFESYRSQDHDIKGVSESAAKSFLATMKTVVKRWHREAYGSRPLWSMEGEVGQVQSQPEAPKPAAPKSKATELLESLARQHRVDPAPSAGGADANTSSGSAESAEAKKKKKNRKKNQKKKAKAKAAVEAADTATIPEVETFFYHSSQGPPAPNNDVYGAFTTLFVQNFARDNPATWPTRLNDLMFFMNNTYDEDLGMTPHEKMFGSKPNPTLEEVMRTSSDPFWAGLQRNYDEAKRQIARQ